MYKSLSILATILVVSLAKHIEKPKEDDNCYPPPSSNDVEIEVINVERKLDVAVSLKCKVSARPSTMLYWTKDGSLYKHFNEHTQQRPIARRLNKNRTTFAFTSMESDLIINHDGLYKCYGVLPCGSVWLQQAYKVKTIEDSITVVSKPKNIQPFFYALTGSVLEYIGNAVELVCDVISNGTFDLEWISPDGKIIKKMNDQGFKKLDNGNLLIEKLNWKDHMGQYICSVKSADGNIVGSTFVYPVNRG